MIRYFIENRISAFMLCLSLVTAGLVSLSRLPVSLLPGSGYPAISVIIEYPGVTPDKIESILTKPVERIIKGVSGIEQIESVSEDGKSRINITFSADTDIKIAAVKVRGRIGLIKDSFPREAHEPVVMRYDPGERPVIIAAARVDGADRDGVREILENRVKPALQRIDGISEIIIAGGEIREIHVETENSMTTGRGLMPEDISRAVDSGNVRLPGGTVEGDSGNLMLCIPSGFSSLSEIYDTMIFSQDGRAVRVGDVSRVKYGTREKDELSRHNGEDMVTIYIHRGGGVNTLELCGNVKQVFDLYPEIKWSMIYDQGGHIESSVANALFTGAWGVAIVTFVLALFFHGKENVLPVALAIPVSMLIVPLFMFIGGPGINIMTISGFALSAGMVVDNGIVIMDAIKRRGEGIVSVMYAVNEMKMPVISSTFTAISIFIPVMLISEKTGRTYGDMAFTVTAALLVSLFFAIVLVPVFHVSLKNINTEAVQEEKFVYHNLSGLHGAASRHVNGIKKRMVNFEKESSRIYKNVLNYAFANNVRVLSAAAAGFLISLILLSFIGDDSVSGGGENEFYIYLEFPAGTSLEKADSYVTQAEKYVRGTDGVQSVSGRTGKCRGTIIVQTADSLSFKEQKKLRDDLKNVCNAAVKNGGGFAYISETDELASREVSIHFAGDDIETLNKTAREAASRINSIDGVDECLLRFREGGPEYTILVDRDSAAAAAVSSTSIAETMRNLLFGPVITKYIDREREVDVRVRPVEADRDSIGDLLDGFVRSEAGILVPVRSVVTLAENEGLSRIFRLNGRRSCSITARIGSLTFREAENRINATLRSMVMPEGYTWSFDRSLAEFREERRGLLIAGAASVLLIYMILASLFESFLLPLLVMTALPFAVAGVSPVLFLSGIPVSPSVTMGLVMLAGIVMNNGILLVESVRRAMDCGYGRCDVEQKIREVAETRFRPVIITAITSILGMVPMVIHTGEGSSLWRPLAVTITSGLFFSTLITLVVLPLICGKYYDYRFRMV